MGEEDVQEQRPNNDDFDSRGKFAKGNKAGFQEGVSGNPGGRPKGRTLLSYVREFLETQTDRKGTPLIEVAAKAYANEMIKGSFKHEKEFIDREEGKVADRIAGHDGGPLERHYTAEELEARISKRIAERDAIEADGNTDHDQA